ncbi:SDR family oxidoreductase [Streptosporangium sp. OZ121]|uniref:SDR family oxidoreductase n=1 Tax=Streptosporangium sp. OZ121 TaxID=3444183 RepID=UPI003F7A2D15
MDLGLAGKVVLVTGGSGSIGAHLAAAFAAEGARVAITYHRNRDGAHRVAQEGVLVNVVAPGPTATRGFLARVPEEFRQDLAGRSAEEIKRFLNRGGPAGHISTPQDVAGIVLYLASATNGNITGSVVHVAGGN